MREGERKREKELNKGSEREGEKMLNVITGSEEKRIYEIFAFDVYCNSIQFLNFTLILCV